MFQTIQSPCQRPSSHSSVPAGRGTRSAASRRSADDRSVSSRRGHAGRLGRATAPARPVVPAARANVTMARSPAGSGHRALGLPQRAEAWSARVPTRASRPRGEARDHAFPAIEVGHRAESRGLGAHQPLGQRVDAELAEGQRLVRPCRGPAGSACGSPVAGRNGCPRWKSTPRISRRWRLDGTGVPGSRGTPRRGASCQRPTATSRGSPAATQRCGDATTVRPVTAEVSQDVDGGSSVPREQEARVLRHPARQGSRPRLRDERGPTWRWRPQGLDDRGLSLHHPSLHRAETINRT